MAHLAGMRQTEPGVTQSERVLSVRWQWTWLAFGVLLLATYLLTSSQQYDADILGELGAINRLDMSSPDPAHMLYVRLGVPYFRTWLALGYTGDALLPMQFLNALFGAGTIMIFVLVLRLWQVSWAVAFLVGSLAAFSYAFWTHVVDAFFIIPAAFFAVLALFLALRISLCRSFKCRVGLGLALGAVAGLAAVAYQTNLLLIPALLVASLSSAREVRSSTLWAWLAVGASLLVVAGGIWLLQAVTVGQVKTFNDMLQWFMFSHGGVEDKLWRRENVNAAIAAPVAWIASVLPVYEGLRLRPLAAMQLSFSRAPSQLALAMIGITGVYAIAVATRHGSEFLKNVKGRAKSYLTGILWFVLPGLAVVWFDPAEVKLWLIPLFGIWWMAATSLDTITTFQKSGNYTLLPATVAVMLIAIGNLSVPILPNHRLPSQPLLTAREATQHLSPQDLLISAGFDWTGYLGYVSSNLRVFNALNAAQSYGKSNVKARLLGAIAETWQNGGRVYIVDYFSQDKQGIWDIWITPFTRLTLRDFDGYVRQPAWEVNHTPVWELAPSP